MTQNAQPSPDWNMIEFEWLGVYLDGSPATGSIKISYNGVQPMLDDDPANPIAIYPVSISKTLTTKTVQIANEEGVLEDRDVGYARFRVPATNDPDITGGGASYRMDESFTRGGGRQGVNFVADIDTPGGRIWLNKLPGGTPTTPAQPLSAVMFSDLEPFQDLPERVELLEQAGPGGGGGGPVAWGDVSGKPTTFPPSAHTHDDRYFTETEADARFATAAQGAKADSAVQPAALSSKADLSGPGGTVPAAQLPGFVDDVLEFANLGSFPATGESGKIYTALATNKTYRWSGSVYVALDEGVVLGETSSTAYRGDRGKTAYDHSQDTTSNPHGVTKAQVGLGNVDNTSDAQKPVSGPQQSALDSKVAVAALTEAVEDAVAALFARSSHVGASWVYDDTSNTLALTVTGGGGGGSTDPEVVRDTIGVAMRVGTGLQLVVDDAGDTITISVSGLAISQVVGLTAALNGKAPAAVSTSIVSTATLTPDATSDRVHAAVTAQAAALAIAAPTGTPVDFTQLMLRIKDDGTARAITWATSGAGSYRAMGVTLPSTTTAGKTMYITGRYHAADSRWDVLSVVWED